LQAFGIGKPRKPRLSERRFTPIEHPLRSTLDARYLDMRAAMASGRREPIAAILTPFFLSVDAFGRESDADDMIDSVLKLQIDREKRTATTTLVSIEENNGVARVLQHYAMTTTAQVGPMMPKALQTLSADTWVCSEGTWLLTKTRTLELEAITGAGAHRHVESAAQTVPPSRFPLFVTARMWEYIEPIARGTRYEDPLDAFLIRNNFGELDGGGTQVGDRPNIEYVDISIWLKDADAALTQVTEELERLGAPTGSELRYSRGTRETVQSFGSTECVAVFLDGTSLPHEVYETQDPNNLIARLNLALEADNLGQFRSHWRGPTETALFLYGKDAEAMKEAMLPVLTSEPLCQKAEVVVRYGRHPSGSESFRVPLRA